LGSEEARQRRDSILEVVDDLVFHMNDARTRFMILSVTSLILAPIAIIVALLLVGYPRFLRFLIVGIPEVGLTLFLYLALSTILSAVWLYVGLKEYRFLSKWNDRFKRFISLREQIDREIDSQPEPQG